MTAVRLVLPFPPRNLSPNVHAHWAVKAADARSYRFTCKVLALKARAKLATYPLPSPVQARIIFVGGNRTLPDTDNALASFKAGVDGLVDAKLITDDSPEHFQIVELLVRRGDKREVRVLLESAR